ncbi:MAG: helix-turn-helix transcriptional regulator [Eubacteriales bacterium]|nr:helix-turn-helix transcriptional regulator [Eubacteriales bacterium]
MEITKESNDIIEKQKIVKQRLVERYIEYRKIRNLTQEDLAHIMGIKRPNISRFESGQCNPTLDLLVKMAECMDLEIRIDLVDKREENNNE